MFISDPSELSLLLNRQKKKVEFNNEVIRKHEKKFENVRCKVNDLLQQCSKNVPCYSLVKTVSTGNTIHLTETKYESTKKSGRHNKSVCLTSNKSRKKQLSCASEAEMNTNNVSPNCRITNGTLPQVLSKKSKKLIGTRSIRSVKSSNSVDITDSSSSEEEPIKKKAKSKPRRQIKKKAKNRKRYLTEDQQKKLAKSLKRNVEIRNLPQFDQIHKFLRGKDEFKVKIKTARQNVPVPFWNTYIYLVQEIERCISKNDWNNLTRLLIALADGPKKYQSFLLKASLINLLCNPAAQEHDLTQFLQECFSCHTEADINTVLTTLFHIENNSENEKINNNNLDATFDSEMSFMDIE